MFKNPSQNKDKYHFEFNFFWNGKCPSEVIFYDNDIFKKRISILANIAESYRVYEKHVVKPTYFNLQNQQEKQKKYAVTFNLWLGSEITDKSLTKIQE